MAESSWYHTLIQLPSGRAVWKCRVSATAQDIEVRHTQDKKRDRRSQEMGSHLGPDTLKVRSRAST
eukprot:3112553-Rhodomonas_salina.8